jgi:fatty acid elongase 3
MGKCAGEEFAAMAGIGIISSYLVLFISFYIATYNKTAKTGRPRRNTGQKSLIDMKNFEVPSPAGAQNSGAKSNGAASTGRSNGPVTRSRKA